MTKWKYVAYPVVIGLLAGLPFFVGVYPTQVISTILIYVTLALSWDMLMRAGLLSFGIAGFFGLGGYGALILQVRSGIDPLLTIVLGGLVAGLVALLLGLAVLRLRGMYFAIVTLALAEIFRVIIKNLPLELTGGSLGMIIPSAIFNGDPAKSYWLMLAIALVAVGVSEAFGKSRVHLALTSIRNDEIVAKSSGIDIFKYLVIVFVVTSILQGITGAAYAQKYAFVFPESSFSVNYTLLPIGMALLGGIYGTWGPVVGAVLLGAASEGLKLAIPTGHLLIYGLVIVVAILFLPRGLVGLVGQQFDKLRGREAA
jgi:branched-chain amino acid transport system permease protein